MEFVHVETVRFGHVDAAGIVFFPRYFEFLNNTVEAWFDAGIGWSYRDIHMRDGLGTPLVETSARFLKASRLGDRLEFALTVTDIARATIDLAVTCRCDGEVRMTATLRHILVQLDPLKSRTIPDDLRAKIGRYRG